MKGRGCCFATLIFLIVPWTLFGGVDVNVYNDTVYLYLDKLYSAGLVETYMPDQRPLTRDAVAKLIKEARENIDAIGNMEEEPLKALVCELEREFSGALSGKNVEFVPLSSFTLSYTATNQEESPIPYNGLGSTSGRVQPLLSYSEGDHFDGYGNVYSSSGHSIKATPYFAAYFEPKYFTASGDDSTGGVGLYRGYVKTGYKDFELQVGRDDILWGPGENSLLFSGNARALDMIKVSSPRPFRLPGFFKNLGNIRATAFFSPLGNDYTPAHSTLSAYRIDYGPVKWVNIGFDHAVFLGGDGLASPDFTTAVRNFIGLLASSHHDHAATNHLMGTDATFHIPHAMGTQAYVKVLFEDTNANTGYMLKTDASWLGGVYLPEINGKEMLSVRAEFIYTGPFSYTHWQYTDGFTVDNKFIGYDAGPDTLSGFISSKYQINFDEFLTMDLRYLRRSNDYYHFVFTANGNIVGIVDDLNKPKEGNNIARVGGQKKVSKILNLYAEAGFDKKRNADFVDNRSATEFVFQIKLTIHSLR